MEEFKQKGNEALQNNDADGAIGFYSEALKIDPNNYTLFSNRSAAYCKKGNYLAALEDAEKTINLKKDWPKGYSRKGAALCFLDRHEEAVKAYKDGLAFDPNNSALLSGLKEAEEASSADVMNPFQRPDLISFLKSNPKTAALFSTPGYTDMLSDLQNNRQGMKNHIQDPRFMTTLEALMNLGDGDVHMRTPEERNESNNNTNKQPAKSNEKSADTPAVIEKEKGNAAYKKKDFETALKHYDNAITMEPTNMTFRLNRTAVLLEQKNYDQCEKECLEAIEIGRENKADFKLLGKAYHRIGNIYQKSDIQKALSYYHKSLSEHRDADVLKKVQAIEKKIKEEEKMAYINPEIAEEEKKKGNDNFQSGNYPVALKHYTEAIKRNPKDARLYSNRAACYSKLMEFQMAIGDAEKAIEMDPTFVKAYLRKGNCLMAMKDMTKAAQVFSEALKLDPNCKEAADSYRVCLRSEDDPEAIKQRAMNDPEVKQILQDPAMQMILQQMQSDPRAASDHMKNPDVAMKIQKLVAAGIIQVR